MPCFGSASYEISFHAFPEKILAIKWNIWNYVVTNSMSERQSTIITPVQKSQWTLWMMLWCFENDHQQPPDPTPDTCSSLMQTWLTFMTDEDRSIQFASTLFSAQLNAHRLLQEWLFWLVHVEADITSTIGLAMISKQWDIDAYETENKPQTVTADDTTLTYNKSLSELLFNEFAPRKIGLVAKTRLTQLSRKDAAIHAACMRLSREWFEGCASQGSTLGSLKTSTAVHQLYTGNGLSASINPCPWLEFETRSFDLPYYLWDIDLDATVILQDVKEPVQGYIAISHTWGRWKLKSEDKSTKFGRVDGVDWDVPLNSRFDVSELPTKLKTLRNDTRYVWMDLLCIPQDLSQKAKEEIARQGAIFRNASKCICWINDIENWDGTRIAVQWLLEQYLRQCGDELWPDKKDIPKVGITESLCELFPGGKESESTGLWQPDEVNPWFTSLWTLQEVCIRPDMILCDKNFLPLGIGPVDWPVSIADIAALMLRVKNSGTVGNSTPVAVSQLFRLFTISGLTNLFKLSRTMVLQLGSGRQCSGRRAEAVMSAMGTVEWYLPYMTDKDREMVSPLVLDMYPRPFLEELRTKAGSGPFFNDSTLDFAQVLKIFYFDNWQSFVRISGSLLPFGTGRPTNVHDSSIMDDDENATRSWIIDNDGSVKVSRAFVQASTEDMPQDPFMCTWCAPAVSSSSLTMTFVTKPSDMRIFLRYFKPERRNFAVSLIRGNSFVNGVLLKEIMPGILMKIGSYAWHAPFKGASIIGQELDVDWVVI